MTDHVDRRMLHDNADHEGLPHAPMAMPEQRLERRPVGFGLHLLLMPVRAWAWNRVR